jgi:surface carbohydrate biosynthesis protein (TIGR04326 family)
LYYYALFRRVMDDAGAPTECLYYCEMQSWEFALVAAARARRPRLRTIGFQHTTVSRNYYFYHHHRDDVTRTTSQTALPLPDTLAANGDRPAGLLAESGYPGLVVVESLRFLGVLEALARTRPPRSRRRPVVLVAGSIVRRETAALLSLVAAAFGGGDAAETPGDEVTVWLKGHPSQPIESVAAAAGVTLDPARYVVRTGDIRAMLADADLVVVPTSAVAVEALAYGCEVVVPVFSALPAMTPLAGFEEYYHRVHSPEELRHAVERFRRHGALVDIDDKRAFVRSYWCLDPRLPRWERLLAGGAREPVPGVEERS